jgi:hypothetical protein
MGGKQTTGFARGSLAMASFLNISGGKQLARFLG